MGDPNKKAAKADPHKNRPVYRPGRLDLDGTTTPPVLAKMPVGGDWKVEQKKARKAEKNNEINETSDSKEDKGKEKMAEGSSSLIHAPQPRRHNSLAFKSYVNGDLITDHFLTPGQPVMAPFPPPKPSPLNATSPSFVPSPKRLAAPFDPTTPPHTVARAQASRYETPTRRPTLHLQTNFGPSYYPTPMTEHHRSSALSQVTTYEHQYERHGPAPQYQVAVVESKIPKTFSIKKDKTRKDILIDEKGIKRNVVQVTERYLPNGMPYQTINEGVANTDILALLEKMGKEASTEFLKKNWIEIVVSLKSQEQEEAEIAEQEQKEKHTAEGASNPCSSSTSKALVVAKELPALIRVLRSLPEHFITTAEKFCVILEFPALSNPIIPTGPRTMLPDSRTIFSRGNSTHTITKSTAFQTHPNFIYMARIVSELNKFTAIQKLDVILAPPANMRTPMTLPQLNCFLPFYDLDFVDWTASWKNTFMSKPETLKQWPLEYLNGQRDRIVMERQKKIDDMVFVHKSVAPPMVVLERSVSKLSINNKTAATVARGRAKSSSPVKGKGKGRVV